MAAAGSSSSSSSIENNNSHHHLFKEAPLHNHNNNNNNHGSATTSFQQQQTQTNKDGSGTSHTSEIDESKDDVEKQRQHQQQQQLQPVQAVAAEQETGQGTAGEKTTSENNQPAVVVVGRSQTMFRLWLLLFFFIMGASGVVVAFVLTNASSSSNNLSDGSGETPVGGPTSDTTTTNNIFDHPPPDWVKTVQEFVSAEDDSPWLTMDLSKDGNVLAVGYPGRHSDTSFPGIVKIYEYNAEDGGNDDGTWVRRRGKRRNNNGDLVGDVAGDEFGGSVVLSGDGNRLAIGAAYFDASRDGVEESVGKVTVYDYDKYSYLWTAVGSPILGIAPYSFTAPLSISSDGTVLAVKGVSSDSFVRIYRINDQQEWVQIGEELHGSTASLSQDGRRVAVGEPEGSGTATVYEYYGGYDGVDEYYDGVGGGWDVVGTFDGLWSRENFGSSVSLSESGTRIAIGASSGYLETFTELYGTVAVYENSNIDAWDPLGSKLGGESSNGIIGKSGSVSLSASGEYLVIGSDSSVQVYQFLGDNWYPLGTSAFSSPGSAVRVSRDGTVIAAATGIYSSSGSLRVFDVFSLSSEAPSGSPSSIPSSTVPPVWSITEGSTFSPTYQEYDDFRWAVCGDINDPVCAVRESAPEIVASIGALHGVRCCADVALPGWKQVEGCDMWVTSQVGADAKCYFANTFPQADNACRETQARLCTREEVYNGCTIKTGCGLDSGLIWTGTQPTGPLRTGYWVAMGTGAQAYLEMNESAEYRFRCCSDEEIPGWLQERCSLYVTSQTPKCQSGTWEFAITTCAGLGGRLCTKQEVMDTCTMLTGCNFDDSFLWTDTVGYAP